MELPRTLLGYGEEVGSNRGKRAIQVLRDVLLYGLFFVVSNVLQKIIRSEPFYKVGQIDDPVLSKIGYFLVGYLQFVVLAGVVLYGIRSYKIKQYRASKGNACLDK